MGKDDSISAAARKTYRDLTRPEQPRKPNGEFTRVPKQQQKSQPQPQRQAQQPAPQAQNQPQPQPQNQQPQPGAIDPNRVPDSWRSEAKAKWAGIEPVVKAEINKREADYRAGHAALRKEVDSARNDVAFSRSLGEVVTPYLAGLQSKNVNVQAAIQDGARLVSILHLGTNEDRVNALRHIVKHFGIQIPKPGEQPAQSQPQAQPQAQPQPQTQPQQFRDPRVDQLLAQQQQQQQREAKAAEEERGRMVDEFVNDPAHDQFGLVYEEMANLIEHGMATSMKEAYEKAVRLNPTAFAAVQSKQEQNRRTEAARVAEEARRAAGAPRSSGKPANFQPAQVPTDPKEKREAVITNAVRGFMQKSGR